MKFYIGTHVVSHAAHLCRAFISVNRLRGRKKHFVAHRWILDSGAFTELLRFGCYRTSPDEYAQYIRRWAVCGELELAVAQDYMCEPFMLQKTGLSVLEHQRLTIERYDALQRISIVPVMPVLQGYRPEEYVEHIRQYGQRLNSGMRVGVGSICKRNSQPGAIVAVLSAINQARPDLRLHGFGLKLTALQNVYICSLLYSADSMAWSYAARRQKRNPNSLSEAVAFANRVNSTQGSRAYQFPLAGV